LYALACLPVIGRLARPKGTRRVATVACAGFCGIALVVGTALPLLFPVFRFPIRAVRMASGR
jgi:hypothetical protein